MPNTEHDQYAETFDVGHSGKDHTVHQRMRANSTIMEHKKILGAEGPPPPKIILLRMQWASRYKLICGVIQLLTVALFRVLVANRGEIRKTSRCTPMSMASLC